MPQLLTLPDPKPHLKDIPSFENSTPEGGTMTGTTGGELYRRSQLIALHSFILYRAAAHLALYAAVIAGVIAYRQAPRIARFVIRRRAQNRFESEFRFCLLASV
jgi:hypothetical protein